jgi:hypothetical protein
MAGQWERKNRQGFSYISKGHIPTALFDNSWLMQLKKAGYFTGYIRKHHAQIGPQKERNQYMKENVDFCYMNPGHLGFDLARAKEFKKLKNSSQVEGLFEATQAFMRSGGDQQYFFDNADASLRDFLHQRDTSKPFCLSIDHDCESLRCEVDLPGACLLKLRITIQREASRVPSERLEHRQACRPRTRIPWVGASGWSAQRYLRGAARRPRSLAGRLAGQIESAWRQHAASG